MALTVTTTGDWSGIEGNMRKHRATIAFDSSYPTGGEALTAAALGLRVIEDIEISGHEGCSFVVETSLPATSVNVKAYVPAIVTEAAGALTLDDYALSGVASTTTTSIGLEASLTDPTTTRFGLMKEVADTEDLSSLATVRVRAWGY